MKLHELKPAKGSVKTNKRLGRGQGSKGTTAGRGHKGSQSRSGYSKKIGFEGGQMPLQRRVPKFGFKNRNKEYFKCVNLDTLELMVARAKTSKVDVDFFIQYGMASKKNKIKILGRGQLKTKLDVMAHACSTTAIKAIEGLGGKFTKV